MHVVLPGEATRAAGRREEDDLPGLRLTLPAGVRRPALALAGGLLLFAGHPPWDQGWAGWLAVAPLVLLGRDIAADRRGVGTGFGWGFGAGMVFFLPLLQWIMRFGVAPWVLLSAVQALSIAGFVALIAATDRWRGRAVVAVVAWVGLEWLRSVFPLNGFPWGVLGYTQHDGGPLLAFARVFGVLGVSAALALVGVALGALLWGARDLRRRPVWAIGPLVAIAGTVLLGVAVPPAPAPTGRSVDIAGVQGNTVELPPITDRGNIARVENIVELMVEATETIATSPDGAPDVVVWPENALDADPRQYERLAEGLARAQAAIGDADLLAGTLLDGPRDRTFRNAIVRYTADGDVADVYDKRVLVPFGEYVPWRWLLGDLPPLRVLPSDGIPGTEAKVFDVGAAVVGPVTCYESIFPRLVRDQVRAGAEVLVVSTNNASFGRSPASRQHLAFSQLRAVETGRWTLHAGISGISAIVDPDGGISQRTELFERALVREELPLVTAATPYVRFGDVIGPVSAVVTGLLVLGGLVVHRRRRAAENS